LDLSRVPGDDDHYFLASISGGARALVGLRKSITGIGIDCIFIRLPTLLPSRACVGGSRCMLIASRNGSIRE
jgi:hypothetical protein